jgi:uncharacterized protein
LVTTAPILVVGSSGRVAAQALLQAGYTVDVFDCFGDLDTIKAARQWTLVPDTENAPFLPSHTALIPLVQEWKSRHPSGGILPTSGFESAPETLSALHALGDCLGNTAQSVQACKNPWEFAQICQQEGFHTPLLFKQSPFTSPSPSHGARPDLDSASSQFDLTLVRKNPIDPNLPEPQNWLQKKSGASGGSHVQRIDAEKANQLQAPFYAQHYIEGRALSALFLCEPNTTTVLSLQEQYLAPTHTTPYRFGGLVTDSTIPERAQDLLIHACKTLARRFKLIGLNGLDAIWDGTQLWLLEINPRPPASLALFSPKEAACLFSAHIMACWHNIHPAANAIHHIKPHNSAVSAFEPLFTQYRMDYLQNPHNLLNRGMAIVYANAQLSIPADFQFPPSCHDLPSLPRTFQAGDPVCSVVVSDGGIGKLRAQVNALRECLKAMAGVDLLSSL